MIEALIATAVLALFLIIGAFVWQVRAGDRRWRAIRAWAERNGYEHDVDDELIEHTSLRTIMDTEYHRLVRVDLDGYEAIVGDATLSVLPLNEVAIATGHVMRTRSFLLVATGDLQLSDPKHETDLRVNISIQPGVLDLRARNHPLDPREPKWTTAQFEQAITLARRMLKQA